MAVRPVIDAGSIAWAVMAGGTPWDTTISVTIGDNPYRLLVAFVKTNTDAQVSGITYNSVAMTRMVDNSVAGAHGCEIWILVNPSTDTHNVVIDATENQFGRSYVACFYNVDPLTPTSGGNTNNATSTSATVVVQTDVDSVAVMCVGSGNGGRTHTSVETTIGAWTESSQSGSCSYFNGDGSNKTMTDNLSGSDVWRSAGLNLKGAIYGSVWNPSPVMGLFEKMKRRTKLYRELWNRGAIDLGNKQQLLPI